jgi:hypothetical protein
VPGNGSDLTQKSLNQDALWVAQGLPLSIAWRATECLFQVGNLPYKIPRLKEEERMLETLSATA